MLDRLRAFKPVRGIYGNVDGAELRADLPEDLSWECGGVQVYITHVSGYLGNTAGGQVGKCAASVPAYSSAATPIF